MAFFGPRLDRPSAVGTEGRPRAASLTVASVVTVGLFVLAGWAIGDAELVVSFGTLVGFTVAGAALQTRERLVHRFVGHLCFLPFGTAVVLRLLALSRVAVGVMTAGLVVAVLALGLTWANVADRDGFRETTTGTGLTYASLFVWVVAASILAVAYGSVLSVVTGSTLADAPLLAFVAFAGLLAATAVAFRLALSSLPILQLTPRADRDRIRARIARSRRATTRVAVAGGVAAVLGLLAEGYGGRGIPVSGTDPVGGALLAVGSPVVLGALVVLGTVALLAAALATALRALTTRLDASTGRVVAAMAAAGLFFALFVLVLVVLPGVLGSVVLSLALLLPLALLLVLGAVLVCFEFGVLPDRAGGPAVAATGLFTAGVGAGLAEVSAPVVFALVAGALVVWDVSTFGLGLTAELGHLPGTRRLELFHAVLAVGVGVVAVVGLWGVVVGRRLLGIAGGGPIAAAVLVVGVLLLATVVRG